MSRNGRNHAIFARRAAPAAAVDLTPYNEPMTEIPLEQILFRRDQGEPPRLLARSPGFADDLIAPLSDILTAFGDRPPGIACPGAIFAQPLGAKHVAVVHVRDTSTGPNGWAGLRFHVLALERNHYEGFGGDPFAVARAVSGFWPALDAPLVDDAPLLDTVRLPAKSLAVRDLAHVQAVLKRIKAHALPDNANPAEPPPLTVDNAESPMLLGGAQVLVDGGRLAFERAKPDASVIEALWTLLPHSLRPRIWPASFAFADELKFDVIVVPRLTNLSLEGYTTEEQAGDYPQGSYELAVQTAAESGSARDLEIAFQRRTSNDTLRLGFKLLVGLSLLVLAFRFWTPEPKPETKIDVVPRAATAASIVGAHDPWMALFWIDIGNQYFKKR